MKARTRRLQALVRSLAVPRAFEPRPAAHSMSWINDDEICQGYTRLDPIDPELPGGEEDAE